VKPVSKPVCAVVMRSLHLSGRHYHTVLPSTVLKRTSPLNTQSTYLKEILELIGKMSHKNSVDTIGRWRPGRGMNLSALMKAAKTTN
jgi:hypothetical protein